MSYLQGQGQGRAPAHQANRECQQKLTMTWLKMTVTQMMEALTVGHSNGQQNKVMGGGGWHSGVLHPWIPEKGSPSLGSGCGFNPRASHKFPNAGH